MGEVPKVNWWQTATFLEVRVEAIQDTTGTGVGDFRGLTVRLPRLRDTGVTALWVTPFYPSAGSDGGYDITCTRSVDPRYGTLDDFRGFLAEAHRHDLRVVIDLVPCHTSDQHPEFVASRQDPDGPFGDHYVWHPTGDVFVSYRDDAGVKQEIRNVLELDSSPRGVLDRDGDLVAAHNWTFDANRGEYYYHPFKKTQPARNFANEAVRRSTLDDVRFWAGLGVDGIRIDAIPFLCQEEGTSCEGLPQVHDYLRWLRQEIDVEYPDLLLWCEAHVPNVRDYFGGGFECQAAFDFETRIGLWLSNVDGDPGHFLDELRTRKAIPDGCTMVQHLGCHDDERVLWRQPGDLDLLRSHYGQGMRGRPFLDDAMVGSFGAKLDHERQAMELMLVQLTLLPGAKLVYYRDLLGLSHNLEVIAEDGDLRRALRGPFQWTGDANAGFSDAPEDRLYLPLNRDAHSHFTRTNFAAQWDDESSWLHFHRRINQIVEACPAFTAGTFDLLELDLGSTWGCVRSWGEVIIAGLCNLGMTAKTVAATLPEWLRNAWRRAELWDVFTMRRIGAVGADAELELQVPPRGYVVASLQKVRSLDVPHE